MDINENINLYEDYVSYETAKLLKKSGFDSNEISCINVFKGHTYKIQDTIINVDEDVTIPTIQMAMKWLREEKDVQIEITIVGTDTWESPTKWMYGFRCQTKDVLDRRNADFSSYEEACETAIQYCLQNLI